MTGRVLLAAAAACLELALAPASARAQAQAELRYRLTLPKPEHHWMTVELALADVPAGPIELRMSRSSPGRYSLHDFAKNVYDVEAVGVDGKPLTLTRPDPYGWTIAAHPASLTVRYKVYGDRTDGTYLGIDRTHAHLNMPASLMFVRGLDARPARVTLTQPPGSTWAVATQLYPTSNPLEFTAPNLQYLMDSPTEFGNVMIRSFDVDGHHFRFAAHHTGSSAELDRYVQDVRRVVETERDVFGKFPTYEPGTYTFIADYLPWANGDGMEHRNSTIITSTGAIATNRTGLLGTVAHEFFHNWNVERIRPKTLEPFDFERANMSGELWLAEGFTQYYGPLTLRRADLVDLSDTLDDFHDLIASVRNQPGRAFRSPEEMSRMAPFADGGRTIDRTNWADTYVSYYPYGGAVALALDLTLRDRSNGRLSLDHFMRAMWTAHGDVAGAPGLVQRPYTIDDAEARLAEVSGDAAFAHDFFARYIHGRESPDFDALLSRAGFVLRPQNPGRAWAGDLRLEGRGGGVGLADAPRANTPAYAAGLDLGDEIRSLDGTRVNSPDSVAAIVRRHRPGEVLTVDFVDRAGQTHTSRLTLAEDPAFDLVTIESTGRALTPAQSALRAAWLGPRR